MNRFAFSIACCFFSLCCGSESERKPLTAAGEGSGGTQQASVTTSVTSQPPMAPAAAVSTGSPPAASAVVSLNGTQYLVFQLTTYDANPEGMTKPFDRAGLAATLDDILRAVHGERGDGTNRQLGFAVGPISFDHTDEQVIDTILQSFEIAVEKDVAVAFHIDDSMFWKKRDDLWRQSDNVEWLDWKRTPNTGRKIDWGRPQKLAPQMCFNSREIVVEVSRRARDVLGVSIRQGVETLRQVGKEHLFAGVIAGWETQIGEDFDTGRDLGYCALTNLGFSASRPPVDIDAERERVVEDFIDLWTRELSRSGVDEEKIYSHTSFIPLPTFLLWRESHTTTYSQALNFAPPSVAFGLYHRSGFSTYPAPGLFEQIYEELRQRGNPPWGSAEGTNVIIGGRLGDSGMGMEGYLARFFNHGATLVNIFAWGIGGEVGHGNPFREATESQEAKEAYRKFLRGENLEEQMLAAPVSPDLLAAKVNEIQRGLPVWLRATGDEARVGPLLEKLHEHIAAQRVREADRTADQILAIIQEKR